MKRVLVVLHCCVRCRQDCDCPGYHMLDCSACARCREEINGARGRLDWGPDTTNANRAIEPNERLPRPTE